MIIFQLQIHEGWRVQNIVTFLFYIFGPTYESPIDFWLKFVLKKDLMQYYIRGDARIIDPSQVCSRLVQKVNEISSNDKKYD